MNEDELSRLRGQLRPAQVRVREASGQIRVESRDGSLIERLPSQNVLIAAAPDPIICPITEFLFVGSQDAAENETELARHQIGAILNVAFGREAFPGRFEYLNCPILDEPGQSLSAEPFRRALQFLHECHDKKMRVLVHCNAGISRSCSVCVAFLMKQAHLSYDEALALVRKTRPAARPNAGFEEQLRKM